MADQVAATGSPASGEDPVLRRVEDGVVWITLNRPEAGNAITLAMREQLIAWLEEAKIETRLVFAGNVLKQPGFLDIPRRVHGELTGTDAIMTQTLFIGVYPGLTPEMRDFVADRIDQFFTKQL